MAVGARSLPARSREQAQTEVGAVAEREGAREGSIESKPHEEAAVGGRRRTAAAPGPDGVTQVQVIPAPGEDLHLGLGHSPGSELGQDLAFQRIFPPRLEVPRRDERRDALPHSVPTGPAKEPVDARSQPAERFAMALCLDSHTEFLHAAPSVGPLQRANGPRGYRPEARRREYEDVIQPFVIVEIDGEAVRMSVPLQGPTGAVMAGQLRAMDSIALPGASYQGVMDQLAAGQRAGSWRQG